MPIDKDFIIFLHQLISDQIILDVVVKGMNLQTVSNRPRAKELKLTDYRINTIQDT